MKKRQSTSNILRNPKLSFFKLTKKNERLPHIHWETRMRHRHFLYYFFKIVYSFFRRPLLSSKAFLLKDYIFQFIDFVLIAKPLYNS